MPYENFREMSDEDLESAVPEPPAASRGAYLPKMAECEMQGRVSNTDEPTDCAVCGVKHGRGNLNVKTNQRVKLAARFYTARRAQFVIAPSHS